MGTYQSPVLFVCLNRLAVVRLFTSAEDFRQFCQRNPEKGHRSSLHCRKTPKNARRGSEVSHNSFLDPISSAENPNNHGRLQRRRRPASSSGCVRGKFPASNPPLSLRHCAEPPSRRQVQNFHRNGSEPRTSFWRTMCFSGFAAWRPSLHPFDAMKLNIC